MSRRLLQTGWTHGCGRRQPDLVRKRSAAEQSEVLPGGSSLHARKAMIMAQADKTGLEPERLPGENSRIYSYFIEFLHLGPGRTYRALSARFGGTPDRFQKLGQRYRWLERAEGYDTAVLAADNLAFEAERQEARRRRLRFELERQEMAAALVRQVAQQVRNIISATFVEERTKLVNGEPERVRIAVRTQALRDVAILMRELNRLALAAAIDAAAEHEHKLQNVHEVESVRTMIAGTFAIGEQMFDGSAPPLLSTASEQLPPGDGLEKAVSAVEVELDTPMLDLSGIGDLYPRPNGI
jgi:hypothetical protein